MKLTRFTDLGLRALMYLGAHPGRTVATAEMSQRLNVSPDHLMKSLQALGARGLVTSTRGRGGGFALSPDAVDARVGDVVRSLESSLALVECFEPGSTCPLSGDCRLADVLAEARHDFFAALDRHTLGDLLVGSRSRLVHLGVPADAIAHR